MKVKQLRELIKNLDDNMEILVTGDDHSYRTASAIAESVTLNKKERMYFEFWGKEHLQPGEEETKALVVN
jgi:hypothetical protein